MHLRSGTSIGQVTLCYIWVCLFGGLDLKGNQREHTPQFRGPPKEREHAFGVYVCVCVRVWRGIIIFLDPITAVGISSWQPESARLGILHWAPSHPVP